MTTGRTAVALIAGLGLLPWLVARSTLVQDASLPAQSVLVLLPNLTNAGERRALRDVELAAPADGAAWLHPRPGERLRAGDAAVLRVTTGN